MATEPFPVVPKRRLHLKECELGFNHRGQKLYILLLKIFRANPPFIDPKKNLKKYLTKKVDIVNNAYHKVV